MVAEYRNADEVLKIGLIWHNGEWFL